MSFTGIMLRCHTDTCFSTFWFAETVCEKWMQNYEYKIAMGYWQKAARTCGNERILT